MSQNKYNKRKKQNSSVLIDAEFRIKAEKMIEKFINSNEKVFEFPTILTNVERAYIHNFAPKYSLKTKSHGFGEHRRLCLYKLVEDENFVHKSANMKLTSETVSQMKGFMFKNPEAPSSRNHQIEGHVDLNNFQPFALTCPPIVPPKSNLVDPKIVNIRRNLSINQYRDQIMQLIDKNRIVLIQGSTGSGKTTQIPQYIMETASHRNEPCRILCTQPRRISAIASAERVCYERNAQIGTSVGYQIRLDSQLSATTNCIFLTPGVFLRYLMGRMPEKLFKNVTHILIDEAHERAKENDFLLTSIKENLNVNPNLKLIIMSATMDTSVFHNYFGKCEELSIRTKQFHVEEHYLEDVLKMVNFTNRKVQELNEKYQSGQMIQATESAFIMQEKAEDMECEETCFDDDFKAYLDELLNNMSTHENPENYFDEFMYLVLNEGAPVDYRHSQTKMTALMICIGRQWTEMVEKLLKNGADPKLRVDVCGYEMNCLDFAEKFCNGEAKMLQILQSNVHKQAKGLSNEEAYNKALLNIYQDSVLKTKQNNFIVEESIDHELIVTLVHKLHTTTDKDGAILIFLPGFDDIMQLSKLINETMRQDFTLFMLHSSMRTDDQKNVFRPMTHGKRKIILSTNIAESSLTINDVIYVIDSGREKQKSYDAISHSSSLRVQWISKASANQRRGRAGRLRDGIVFRIYSRDRFNSMLEVTIPELLRTSLTEVCLQSKLLVDEKTKIEEFLQKCIASPSLANIKQSVKYLQKMGALDETENLTHLGSHLVGMPLEAKYAKMLLYAIIFKCVNPILSLTSILTMGDQVFIIPVNPADRYQCEKWKRSMAYEAYSDHFLMLKIFNKWLHLKQTNQNERKFCEENFISSYHIEQVRGIRNQISNHLHSSGLLRDNTQDMNKNSSNWSLIKAIVAAGLYPFVARVEKKRAKMYTEIDNKLSFHMSSVLYVKKEGFKQTIKNIPFEWAVFEEKNRIGRNVMLKCNTLVGNFPMCLLTGLGLKEEIQKSYTDDDDEWLDTSDEDEEDLSNFSTLKIDNFVKFFLSQNESSPVLQFRKRINNLIARFLCEKNFKHSRIENELVDAVAGVLNNEDRKYPRVDVNAYNQAAIESMPHGKNRSKSRNGPSGSSGQNDKFSRNSSAGTSYSQNKGNGCKNPQDWKQPPQNSFDRPNGGASYSRTNQTNDRNSPANHFQMDNRGGRKEKFYVLKMNSQKMFGKLKTNTVCEIGELGLKIWQFHKIKSIMMSGSRVYIILYSTATRHFLGYGEVCKINENQPVLFLFRCARYMPLSGLGTTKFAQDIAHPLSVQSFQFHELDSVAGNSLIQFFSI